MLTLLTTTGARQKAWELCEKMMAAQTYQGQVRWIVVDDGPEPQEISFVRENWAIEVHRPMPLWTEGQNTQRRNLQYGLDKVGGDERVVVIEDDDYYAPGYLADVSNWLDRHELVGESMARYYNIKTGRGKQLINAGHASLCSTAMRGRGLDWFRKAVLQNEKFIDLWLWRHARCTRRLYETKHVVGIKGLPGRLGIGSGHKNHFGRPMSLKGWIPDSEKLYGL